MREVPDSTGTGVTLPPLDTVKAVLAALEDAGICAAVGGSGLLAALGLVDRAGDWDLTTDADPERVEAALTVAGISSVRDPSRDDGYATKAWLHAGGENHDVDILLGFAIRANGTVVNLPTRITRRWLGLPIADPTVWAMAYRLMGRHDRADLLDGWLREEIPR